MTNFVAEGAVTVEKTPSGRGGGAPPAPPPEGPNGGGGGGPASPGGRGVVLSNARLAMVVFIAAELMFFAGLISAFLVFRLSGRPWPPPFLPSLPVGVTAVNTVILLLSSFTMVRAQRAARNGDASGLISQLAITGGLGILFLVVQGYEWIQLLRFGLTISSGVYGSTFFTIIGAHGAHVLGAVIWLMAVLAGAWMGRYTPERLSSLQICGMYWHMVVGLWPVLFFLVYLL